MLRPDVIDVGIGIAQKHNLEGEALVLAFEVAWSIGASVAKYARLKFEKNPPAEGITDSVSATFRSGILLGVERSFYLYCKAQE